MSDVIMTNITDSAKCLTMSSRELLELVNAARSAAGESQIRYNDFMARVKDELDGDHYEIFVVQNPNNTASEVAALTPEQCMLVSMRESKAVRRAVRDKLDAMAKPAIPKSYAAALLEAGRLALELEQAQQQLQEAAPAVAFMDRYVEAKSTKAIREVAKVLGIRERQFIEYLEQNRIMYRIGRDLVPYAQYQHRGLFEVKTGETHGHAWQQTRFTPEGVAWIASRITKELGGVA